MEKVLVINFRGMTLSKFEWTQNNKYQNLFDRAKSIIKNNETMAFYNKKEPLCLDTVAAVVGLWASFLQGKVECGSQGMTHLSMQCCSQ